MQNETVALRFGLILEAYLNASPDHCAVLAHQVEAILKLKGLSDIVRGKDVKVGRGLSDIVHGKEVKVGRWLSDIVHGKM